MIFSQTMLLIPWQNENSLIYIWNAHRTLPQGKISQIPIVTHPQRDWRLYTHNYVLFHVPFALGSYSDILELEPHRGARWLRSTGDLQYGSQQDVQQAGHYHIDFLQHRFFLKRKK